MSMNRIIPLLIAMGLLATVGVAEAQQFPAEKIVTINMQKIFDEYHKTPVARSKLEETRDQFTAELQSKQEDLKSRVEELNELRAEQDQIGRAHV